MVLIIKLHIYVHACTFIISVSQVISKVERTSIGYFFFPAVRSIFIVKNNIKNNTELSFLQI